MGASTFSKNVVVIVIVPCTLVSSPVTVMGNEPIGVAEVVKMVSTLEYDPTPADVTLKLHVAPAGSPSESGQSTMVMGKIEFEITLMVFDPEPPWVTVISPELVRIKPRVKPGENWADAGTVDTSRITAITPQAIVPENLFVRP